MRCARHSQPCSRALSSLRDLTLNALCASIPSSRRSLAAKSLLSLAFTARPAPTDAIFDIAPSLLELFSNMAMRSSIVCLCVDDRTSEASCWCSMSRRGFLSVLERALSYLRITLPRDSDVGAIVLARAATRLPGSLSNRSMSLRGRVNDGRIDEKNAIGFEPRLCTSPKPNGTDMLIGFSLFRSIVKRPVSRPEFMPNRITGTSNDTAPMSSSP
mmetsp:Transcript_6514/g.17429  ORF Transcript_6514/g.17429 Transcript_6514/m.17429 type:complete len:215 (-) Transcript_6514:2327-2971(-)